MLTVPRRPPKKTRVHYGTEFADQLTVARRLAHSLARTSRSETTTTAAAAAATTTTHVTIAFAATITRNTATYVGHITLSNTTHHTPHTTHHPPHTNHQLVQAQPHPGTMGVGSTGDAAGGSTDHSASTDTADALASAALQVELDERSKRRQSIDNFCLGGSLNGDSLNGTIGGSIATADSSGGRLLGGSGGVNSKAAGGVGVISRRAAQAAPTDTPAAPAQPPGGPAESSSSSSLYFF